MVKRNMNALSIKDDEDAETKRIRPKLLWEAKLLRHEKRMLAEKLERERLAAEEVQWFCLARWLLSSELVVVYPPYRLRAWPRRRG